MLPIAVTLFRLGFCYCIARMVKNKQWVDRHLGAAVLCCLAGLIVGAPVVPSATDLFIDVAPLAMGVGIIWGVIADRYPRALEQLFSYLQLNSKANVFVSLCTVHINADLSKQASPACLATSEPTGPTPDDPLGSRDAQIVADIRSTATDTRTAAECSNPDSQLSKINNWLTPPDPSTNLSVAKRNRHEGTGSWFLQSEPFREWKSGSRRSLWVHGNPGCGKTVLCSTIIEHLRQYEDPSRVVLYFFFDFNDTKKQSLNELARSITTQLYSRCEYTRKDLDTLFSSCEYGRRQPTTESLFAAFQQMMNNVKKIHIVIDALDECETRADVLLWMEELSGSRYPKFYLLITSREEEEIKSELNRWLHQDNFVSIQPNLVSSDICAYVRKRLREDRGLERWRSEPLVQDEIEIELMKKADGM
jgi:hypothetical protein